VQSVHSTAEVAVNLKKIITWLFFALVVLFVINAPADAAQFVRNAGDGLANAASALTSFVGSLV
jgi:hypothetical protein